MPNTIATPNIVMKETGKRLVNRLMFATNVTRTYDDQWDGRGGAKIGYTVNARLPQMFTVTEGQALQLQALNDQTVPITLTHQKNVAFAYSTASRTVELELIRERYINPAADALANQIDFDGLNTVYKDIYTSVGTPGTTPTSRLTYQQAVAKLMKLGAPITDLVGIIEPLAQVNLVNDASTLMNPSARVSEQYRTGQFAGAALGVGEWYVDQNVATHTTGSFTSATPTVNGAGQTGSSLITQAWASGATTLNKGDLFTVAGVYAVNAMSKASTGQLQQFVVTSTISDTAGAMTIGISPSIITSGQRQTVTASPADSAAIIPVGSTITTGAGTMTATASPQSLIFDPDAFALVMADLYKPSAGAVSETVRSKTWGVSLRRVTQYMIGTDQEPSRLDALYGWATVRPELAVRVQG
jgi:hypothetical protein